MDNPVLPYLCVFALVCINPAMVGLIVWYLTKYGSPIQWKPRHKTKKVKSSAPAALSFSEELED